MVDMHVGLVDSPIYRRETVLAKLKDVLEKARAKNAPVVFVIDGEHADVHPDVAPREGETCVRRSACDAFHATDLDAHLRRLGVTDVVIGGCRTQLAIDTTIRRAVTLGYDVTLIRDGHSTTDTDLLPAPTIIAHHQATLEGFGAVVDGAGHAVAIVPAASIEL